MDKACILVVEDEIIVAMSTGPLLRAKIAIDSVVVRNIRFNSERETPGEVDTLRERSTLFREEMARWRASARIPTTNWGENRKFRESSLDWSAEKSTSEFLRFAREDFEGRRHYSLRNTLILNALRNKSFAESRQLPR